MKTNLKPGDLVQIKLIPSEEYRLGTEWYAIQLDHSGQHIGKPVYFHKDDLLVFCGQQVSSTIAEFLHPELGMLGIYMEELMELHAVEIDVVAT